MTRILVVANQTLGGDALVRAVEDRMNQGASEFVLLVPATRKADRESTSWALSRHIGSGLPPDEASRGAEEEDYEHARRELALGLERLKRLGAAVDGDTGDSDPVTAIDNVLKRQPFDEIILSTLPSGASRWLSMDVPHKVKRKFRIPVTVVTAAPPR
jgi:nucleotide-binding universal stress UspA family protein